MVAYCGIQVAIVEHAQLEDLKRGNGAAIILRPCADPSNDGSKLPMCLDDHVELAGMGAFKDSLMNWRNPDNTFNDDETFHSFDGRSINEILARVGAPVNPANPLLELKNPTSWSPESWVGYDVSTLKRWWNAYLSEFLPEGEVLFPFESKYSANKGLLKRTAVLSSLGDKLHKKQRKHGDDYAVFYLCFAILVGGKGSPPHCDTMGTTSLEGTPLPSSAVGIVLQGRKAVSVLPPVGGYFKQIVDVVYMHAHT